MLQTLFYNFLCWCPGALGLFLRQRYLGRFFYQCGKGCLFGRLLKISNPENIALGDKIVIDTGVSLLASATPSKKPSITVRDGVFIGSHSKLESSGNQIEIKNGASIGSHCFVTATQPVIIEEDALIGAFCTIGLTKSPHKKQEISRIGHGCWLGARVDIASGISIGIGSIVGAQTLVREDVADMAVSAGRPARTLYSRSALKKT